MLWSVSWLLCAKCHIIHQNENRSNNAQFPCDLRQTQQYRGRVYRSNHPNLYDYHRMVDQLTHLAAVSHHDRANHLTLSPPPRADRLNATVPLRLSTSLTRDVGLAPWSVTHRHLDTWLQLLYDQVTHAPLEDFVRRLIRPLYQQLGWRDEGSHVTRLEVVAAVGGCVRAGALLGGG